MKPVQCLYRVGVETVTHSQSSLLPPHFQDTGPTGNLPTQPQSAANYLAVRAWAEPQTHIFRIFTGRKTPHLSYASFLLALPSGSSTGSPRCPDVEGKSFVVPDHTTERIRLDNFIYTRR